MRTSQPSASSSPPPSAGPFSAAITGTRQARSSSSAGTASGAIVASAIPGSTGSPIALRS
jgi:hypothetical protein